VIAKLSTRIAEFIRKNDTNAASMEVLMFSLTIVLNALFITVAILAISAITGRLLTGVLLIISYVTLRFFSGGVHLPTSRLCNAISIGVFCVLMFLSVPYWNVGVTLNALAFMLILAYAPTKDIMHLNRLGPKYTIHFKLISIALVLVNFWIQSPVLALAFFTQALSLTPLSYKAVNRYEGG